MRKKEIAPGLVLVQSDDTYWFVIRNAAFSLDAIDGLCREAFIDWAILQFAEPQSSAIN